MTTFNYLNFEQKDVLADLGVKKVEDLQKKLGAYLPQEKEYVDKYPVADVLTKRESVTNRQIAQTKITTYRNWNDNGYWGNQGDQPQCVAYTGVHYLEDGPVTQGGKTPAPLIQPQIIYDEAQKVDEWAGENYAGTSVNALFKVLKSRGYVSGYHWATNVEDVAACLLHKGPVALGVRWDTSMFFPDSKFIIRPNGKAVGGHALIANGINMNTKLIRLKNSWGRGWANKGRCYISFSDLNDLLLDYGEACIADEIRVP